MELNTISSAHNRYVASELENVNSIENDFSFAYKKYNEMNVEQLEEHAKKKHLLFTNNPDEALKLSYFYKSTDTHPVIQDNKAFYRVLTNKLERQQLYRLLWPVGFEACCLNNTNLTPTEEKKRVKELIDLENEKTLRAIIWSSNSKRKLKMYDSAHLGLQSRFYRQNQQNSLHISPSVESNIVRQSSTLLNSVKPKLQTFKTENWLNQRKISPKQLNLETVVSKSGVSNVNRKIMIIGEAIGAIGAVVAGSSLLGAHFASNKEDTDQPSSVCVQLSVNYTCPNNKFFYDKPSNMCYHIKSSLTQEHSYDLVSEGRLTRCEARHYCETDLRTTGATLAMPKTEHEFNFFSKRIANAVYRTGVSLTDKLDGSCFWLGMSKNNRSVWMWDDKKKVDYFGWVQQPDINTNNRAAFIHGRYKGFKGFWMDAHSDHLCVVVCQVPPIYIPLMNAGFHLFSKSKNRTTKEEIETNSEMAAKNNSNIKNGSEKTNVCNELFVLTIVIVFKCG